MTFDAHVLRDYWPMFMSGLSLTIRIAMIAPALALVFGALLALIRLSRNKLLASGVMAFSEVVRDLPFIVLLFLVFYLLPVLGIKLPPLFVGIITLSVYGAAYFSEIIRGAVQSVPKGQMEAARSMGMSHLQAFRHIIVPQMMGYFLPPATSQAILVVKESAVLSTITVAELTMAGQVVQGYTYSPIEVFALISVLYWILCTLVSRAGIWLEFRVDPAHRKGGLRHA
jgi:His/Glu/Gln/Arg/opine family amino acid ABC transporter permease subunit